MSCDACDRLSLVELFPAFRDKFGTKSHADLISAAALSVQVSSSEVAVLFKLEVLAPWSSVS